MNVSSITDSSFCKLGAALFKIQFTAAQQMMLGLFLYDGLSGKLTRIHCCLT
jgi:hypothetical protein